jgi:hypothetical protein
MATIGKYQISSGATLYEVRYRTPDRRSTRKRGFATLRDAKTFANTVETAKVKGEYVSASVGRVTIGELGPLWLERQHGHLKPKTFQSTECAWRVHIAPRWADVRIADIRYTDVAAWVAEMAAATSPALVRATPINPGPGERHSRLDHQLERQPETLHLDQERRRDPRTPRLIYSTNPWRRTLGRV